MNVVKFRLDMTAVDTILVALQVCVFMVECVVNACV